MSFETLNDLLVGFLVIFCFPGSLLCGWVRTNVLYEVTLDAESIKVRDVVWLLYYLSTCFTDELLN